MKEVVRSTPEVVVLVSQAVPSKIYACNWDGTVYKAGRVSKGYAFIFVGDSESWANGSHTTLESLLESALDSVKIYQFETQKEFAEWLLKNS